MSELFQAASPDQPRRHAYRQEDSGPSWHPPLTAHRPPLTAHRSPPGEMPPLRTMNERPTSSRLREKPLEARLERSCQTSHAGESSLQVCQQACAFQVAEPSSLSPATNSESQRASRKAVSYRHTAKSIRRRSHGRGAPQSSSIRERRVRCLPQRYLSAALVWKSTDTPSTSNPLAWRVGAAMRQPFRLLFRFPQQCFHQLGIYPDKYGS
jgi:hypothetical protein